MYNEVIDIFNVKQWSHLICFINIIYLEPVDGGTEQTLKLRLSTTLGDVKLPVYSKDTIGIAKKKLQVCIVILSLISIMIYYDLTIFGFVKLESRRPRTIKTTVVFWWKIIR